MRPLCCAGTRRGRVEALSPDASCRHGLLMQMQGQQSREEERLPCEAALPREKHFATACLLQACVANTCARQLVRAEDLRARVALGCTGLRSRHEALRLGGLGGRVSPARPHARGQTEGKGLQRVLRFP